MLVSPSSMRAPSSVLAVDSVKDTSSMYDSGLLGAQKCPEAFCGDDKSSTMNACQSR